MSLTPLSITNNADGVTLWTPTHRDAGCIYWDDDYTSPGMVLRVRQRLHLRRPACGPLTTVDLPLDSMSELIATLADYGYALYTDARWHIATWMDRHEEESTDG
jgi:hypothetical protein